MSKTSASDTPIVVTAPADSAVVVEPVATPVVEPAPVPAPTPAKTPKVTAPAAPAPYEAKHFERSEFACACCGEVKVSDELLEVLDDVREHFNSPTSVTSGFRCDAHNEAVGGKPGSQHKEGTAADIQVSRIPPRTVQKYLREKYAGKYGIGCYRTFTHVDVREAEARW